MKRVNARYDYAFFTIVNIKSILGKNKTNKKAIKKKKKKPKRKEKTKKTKNKRCCHYPRLKNLNKISIGCEINRLTIK